MKAALPFPWCVRQVEWWTDTLGHVQERASSSITASTFPATEHLRLPGASGVHRGTHAIAQQSNRKAELYMRTGRFADLVEGVHWPLQKTRLAPSPDTRNDSTNSDGTMRCVRPSAT